MDIRIGANPIAWSNDDPHELGGDTPPELRTSTPCRGDGRIDYLGASGKLAGYRGWSVIDAKHDPKKAPPPEYGAMGSTHVRQAWSATDLS